jgi:hypothetical protein
MLTSWRSEVAADRLSPVMQNLWSLFTRYGVEGGPFPVDELSARNGRSIAIAYHLVF